MFKDDYLKLQIFSAVLIITANVFSAMAIYNDCRLNNIKHTKIITVLGLIFGVPAVGIYFIVRRFLPQEVATVCSKCGKRVRKGVKECPKCGGKHFSSQMIENRSEITQKVIIFIVIALSLYATDYWLNNYSALAENAQRQVEEQYEEEYAEYDEAVSEEYSEDNGNSENEAAEAEDTSVIHLDDYFD